MASLLQAIISCITGAEPTIEAYPDEKQAILCAHEPRTAEAIADEVLQAIQSAEKCGRQLQAKLNEIVGEYGWTERVAEWLLVKLEQVLKAADKVGPALKDAYDRACEAAMQIEGFVKEHPVFCTVIALGVLVTIAPWAIEALGFGELGPIEGMSCPPGNFHLL